MGILFLFKVASVAADVAADWELRKTNEEITIFDRSGFDPANWLQQAGRYVLPPG